MNALPSSLMALTFTRPQRHLASTSTTSACSGVPQPRLPAAGLLLHRPGGGSGIFLHPPADRLARLQRLHRGHQGRQGVHRFHGPPEGEGQHGHRAGGGRHGARAAFVDHIVLFSGDGDFRSLVEALQRRGVKVSVVSTVSVAAGDDRRRAAPPGRRVHRPRPSRPARRPRSVRAADPGAGHRGPPDSCASGRGRRGPSPPEPPGSPATIFADR
jgi:hypothetical protein